MKIRLKTQEFRLFLAVCLCLALFLASSHSHDHHDNCGGESFQGDLLVVNNSKKEEQVHFHYSGASNGALENINPGHSMTRELPHGEYAFKLVVMTYETVIGTDGPESRSKSSLGKSGHFVIYAGRSAEITWP